MSKRINDQPPRTNDQGLMTIPPNLFANIPRDLPEELFETLISANGLRIERIISHGQASPAGFWYDQDDNEWILLLQGAAQLRFENHAEPFDLIPGTHLLIPAHTRHRVAWTDPAQPTIWLAIHYSRD